MGYSEIAFPKDSHFLVTGGAGFIGSNLCEALLGLGYRVRCLDDFSTGSPQNIAAFKSSKQFELMAASIVDVNTCLKACEGIDYVLHQAAWGSVPKSIKMPLNYEEVNIKGTLNMLEAAAKSKVKKFVYASSSSVYGDSQQLVKIEGQEGSVLSPYALTKKVNEEYGKLYASTYGLDTVGLRYFNVFGRRQNPEGDYAAVIPKLINQLLSNERPTINGDGLQSRDFTYIENVLEANLKAAASERKTAGKVYNVACGKRITLNKLYSDIARLLAKTIRPHYAPKRTGDIRHSLAAISKAEEAFGYEPYYDYESGIRETVEWYFKRKSEIGEEVI